MTHPQTEAPRLEQALLALHDHGTRPKATANSVQKAMEKDGFTRAEILAAVEHMRGNQP